MRILIVSQYYPPEVTAGAMRVESFATGLAARGHRVEVVCEVPSHPQGVIPPEFRGRPVFRREEAVGVTVNRVWVHARPTKTVAHRLANYASFATMASLVGARRERPDVVVASSPPLPVGSAAAAIARWHRVPWVLDVRDLWPDIAVVLGQLPEGAVLRIARRLERRLYRSAALITAVTEPFREHIEARGGEGKVSVVYNGTTALFLDSGKQAASRDDLQLPADGRFLMTYAGNIGLAQGLEAAVEAAGELGDGFRLLLLGEGPRRPALEEMARRFPSDRVIFRDLVRPERAASIMSASDALLVPLADRPELRAYVPSKLFDACAVGRPVVVATGGEPERLVASAGAALCVPPEDSNALAAAIRRLRDEPKLAARLADRGAKFAAEHHRERGVEQLERMLHSLDRT
jgi:glycosyltransferase involved in cell wall biosynthesis